MNDERECLALYCDINSKHDIKGMFAYIEEWFYLLGVKPDTYCISGTSLPKEPVEKVTIEKYLNSKKIKNVRSLEIFNTIQNYKQLIFGWNYCAELNIEENTVCLGWLCKKNAIDKNQMIKFTKELKKYSTIKYGIGYRREFDKGPLLYVHGLVAGLGYSDEEMKESDTIASWMHDRLEANRYLSGYIRDVYPFNVLSQNCLDMPIGEQSFSEWILSSRNNGSLEQFENDLWFWIVDENEINRIRKFLKKYNLIICT